MRRISAVFIVLLVVLMGGWWALREGAGRERAEQVPTPPGATPRPPTPALPAREPLPSAFTEAPHDSDPAPDFAGASEADAGRDAPPPEPLTAGGILAEPDDDHPRVARRLLALALNPAASAEERKEALAHALNLAAGREAELLPPLLQNPRLPDSMAETILVEALNGPLDYQADLYLEALGRRKDPALQQMIREHLAFLTGGEDLGPDPAAWREAVKAAKAGFAEN